MTIIPTELMNYLGNYFITKQQLIEQVGIDEAAFQTLQLQDIMPKYSYRIQQQMNCESFFGPHQENSTIEYYAKGYISWLSMVLVIQKPNSIYNIFEERYKNTLLHLKMLGYHCKQPKLNENLTSHIKEEWQHFLNGTYGLCTRTGMPEDIAAKELAVAQINDLTRNNNLPDDDRIKLTNAVALLDKASALFAPHERKNSSRDKLIEQVRRKYNIS